MTEMPTWLLGTAADGIPTLPDSLPLSPGTRPKEKQKNKVVAMIYLEIKIEI
jgi:hypothetical protein